MSQEIDHQNCIAIKLTELHSHQNCSLGEGITADTGGRELSNCLDLRHFKEGRAKISSFNPGLRGGTIRGILGEGIRLKKEPFEVPLFFYLLL